MLPVNQDWWRQRKESGFSKQNDNQSNCYVEKHTLLVIHNTQTEPITVTSDIVLLVTDYLNFR